MSLSLFTGNSQPPVPSSCYISAQLNCFQIAISSNGIRGASSLAFIVFTNNLGTNITFPASNAVIVAPTGSSKRYYGNCYPANAVAGATITCSAALPGYSANIGTLVNPSFQITYSQCNNPSCNSNTIYNTSGTGTSYVSPSITEFQATLLTVPSGGLVYVNGIPYPSGSIVDLLKGSKYSVDAAPPSGFGSFGGWITSGGTFVSNSMLLQTSVGASYNGIIEALYKCNPLSLNGNPPAGGSESASLSGLCPIQSGSVNSYIPGTSVSITASPASNYNFQSWTGSGTGSYTGNSNPVTIVMDSGITETANYALQCYSLTLSGNPSADGTVSPSISNSPGCPTGSYIYGQQVQIQASPSAGYGFSSWSGTYSSSSNPYTITITGPTSEIANFYTECYPLTLSGSPSADGTESPSISNSLGCATGSYTYDQQVQIQAYPSSTYGFSSWSGTYSSSSNPYTITITGPTSETANFYTLPTYSTTTVLQYSTTTAIYYSTTTVAPTYSTTTAIYYSTTTVAPTYSTTTVMPSLSCSTISDSFNPITAGGGDQFCVSLSGGSGVYCNGGSSYGAAWNFPCSDGATSCPGSAGYYCSGNLVCIGANNNPVYFNNAGSFSGTATFSDSAGNQCSASGSVTVNPASSPAYYCGSYGYTNVNNQCNSVYTYSCSGLSSTYIYESGAQQDCGVSETLCHLCAATDNAGHTEGTNAETSECAEWAC